MPRVPYPDEENHEQPDTQNRPAPPEERPDAAGDEKLQQIARLRIARLIATARKFKKARYESSSIFVRVCSQCWKPWGMHYGNGCCHWDKGPQFKYDEKLTELFNSIRVLLGSSCDDDE